MVELALALGIAINLICTELFGLASGGLIVPGYLALHLNQPARIASTLAIAALTWGVVRYGWMRLVVLYRPEAIRHHRADRLRVPRPGHGVDRLRRTSAR